MADSRYAAKCKARTNRRNALAKRAQGSGIVVPGDATTPELDAIEGWLEDVGR